MEKTQYEILLMKAAEGLEKLRGDDAALRQVEALIERLLANQRSVDLKKR